MHSHIHTIHIEKMNISVKQETEVRARQQELLEQTEAEKRAKKNYNFVQIEKITLRFVRELYADNPAVGKLLFILAEKNVASKCPCM